MAGVLSAIAFMPRGIGRSSTAFSSKSSRFARPRGRRADGYDFRDLVESSDYDPDELFHKRSMTDRARIDDPL